MIDDFRHRDIRKREYLMIYEMRELEKNYQNDKMYSDLFTLLKQEHNITAISTEMDEIIDTVIKNIKLHKWRWEFKKCQ